MQNMMMFIFFIIIVILIYSLLNYYFLKKQHNILTSRSFPLLLLKLVIFTIILTPFGTILFSGMEIPGLAAITGFTGYSWLAFLFLFLVIHGSVDLVLFIVEKAGYNAPRYMAREIFVITLLISVSVLVFGFFEARDIRLETLTVKTDKLPADVDTLTIMQISDVHFSPLVSDEMAEKIYTIAEKERPDLIVSTGDLLDRAIRNSNKIVKIMSDIKAPLGKYAITGNHEFITGIEYSLDFIRKTGFTMIRNKHVIVNNIINLAGIDDPAVNRFGKTLDVNREENKTLSAINNELYTILLKHQPRVNKENLEYFDLQLSGHTHAGQIFPFTGLVKIFFPYLCGLYELDADTMLYVSRGTGTWGPPFRFLAPPEITLIKLKNKNRNQ